MGKDVSKVHQWLSELLNKYGKEIRKLHNSASLHCMTECTTHCNLKIPDLYKN